MPTALILTAGKGTKIWPYDTYRPKCLLPIANQPLLVHQVNTLKELGMTRIIVATHRDSPTIMQLFIRDPTVEVHPVGETSGTAESLAKAFPKEEEEPVLVIYGDCWIDRVDLAQLLGVGTAAALLTKHVEPSRNHIGACIQDGFLSYVAAHSRDKTTHHFLAFLLHADYLPFILTAPSRFPQVDVGMMAPKENFLEAGLIQMLDAGVPVKAMEAQRFAMDIDKPWHLLEANRTVARQRCREILTNTLLDGAVIDPTASIQGKVRLGKNSKIGRQVIVEGNLWVGDNTIIDNGAFIRGESVIGDQCEIGYGCYIDTESVVGNRCKVLHGAELSGVIFPNVYLYHYMEIAGMVGENSDIGAGTVCGSLRFDDALSTQRVKGRREFLTNPDWANACYIGDQCRTGVNSILLPGVKMGSESILGPGVILSEDLESGKLLLLKQELLKKDWNTDKYGW
ncbi:MAG: NTP transferase domain-containing protein [Lunatimonas sp.]|uniref:NTP transferase domain-containing protein n=1 Tax=Lunatimonas sp. TaxID=2060141 RepID=UPI00263B270E|nr:NTP transferase domain-containing protein [Lunatimonas sp.]MCC5936318.1 NTP transferase domain-containing protein [Lunatimonas sp.]